MACKEQCQWCGKQGTQKPDWNGFKREWKRVMKRGEIQKGLSMSVIVSIMIEISVHWKELIPHACVLMEMS